MKTTIAIAAMILSIAPNGCGDDTTGPTADQQQAMSQAQSLEQAHAAVGMPAITNWQEKRMMKDLYELRDKAVATHAYIVNEMQGCLVYLGAAQGYGLPYATEYTPPTRNTWHSYQSGSMESYPQAEPNGLFMPAAAEGTWIMLLDPTSDAKDPKVMPVYVEPRVIVSPFRLEAQECPKAPPPTPAKK